MIRQLDQNEVEIVSGGVWGFTQAILIQKAIDSVDWDRVGQAVRDGIELVNESNRNNASF